MNNITTFIRQERSYRNNSFYYQDRNGNIYGLYLGQHRTERSSGIDNWTNGINHLHTIGNVYGNLQWFTSQIINDIRHFQSQPNNTELQREIDSLRERNQILEKDLDISRKVNLDLLRENEKLKQALEMIMTQSQLEFDKIATIIGYERQKQILQEMFEEQRRVLSQQLQELATINIPGTRSITQLTITLMVNRIKRYFDNNEISELIPQTRINTTQESINLNLSGTADEIFKQFYPKKQNE